MIRILLSAVCACCRILLVSPESPHEKSLQPVPGAETMHQRHCCPDLAFMTGPAQGFCPAVQFRVHLEVHGSYK